MGDALVINLVMNGNVGYSRSRPRGGDDDGEDEEPTTPRSGTISPACKLFLRVFGVVFAIVMDIVVVTAPATDADFVPKGICLATSLLVALLPFVLTRDEA